jgi:hypothetical protein
MQVSRDKHDSPDYCPRYIRARFVCTICGFRNRTPLCFPICNACMLRHTGCQHAAKTLNALRRTWWIGGQGKGSRPAGGRRRRRQLRRLYKNVDKFRAAAETSSWQCRSRWLSSYCRCLTRRWTGLDPRSRPDLQLVWKSWLFSVILRPGARCKLRNCTVQLYKIMQLQKQRYFCILRPGSA